MARHHVAPPAAPGILRCYAVFHLNLAFSSIEEADRLRVLERCYWPLVDLVRRHHLPLAIEAPAYTLEAAAALDPEWIAALRAIVTDGPAELVGSGYAQLIGPLVPATVVRANLEIGHRVYERLLGLRPRIALVNEQAWSASLARHYRDAGYRAVIMEWENPRATHPDWPDEWQYQPQSACGQDGTQIPLLWSHTIAFQKLQRYAHGEMDLEEYCDYVLAHRGTVDRSLAIYASDAEVFDYRPGRYRTEAPLAGPSEWKRIEAAFLQLGRQRGVSLTTPSAALAGAQPGSSLRPLHLETAEKPVPVKKQPKYDLARWAVTGRDDLGANTMCSRAFDVLQGAGGTEADWRELCYLWSSDFRTHITTPRWNDYVTRLGTFVAKLGGRRAHTGDPGAATALVPDLPDEVAAVRQGRYLTIDTHACRVRLNCRRGLAIDALTIPAISDEPLCGSVPHGYFEDIAWSADQYTGFLVLAASGRPQVTDLESTEPIVGWDPGTASVVVRGCIATPLGSIEKELRIGSVDAAVAVRYRLRWSVIPLGTLRLGHVTLLPTAFDPSSLYVAAHNGGEAMERFDLSGHDVDHVVPVSHLVSCRGGFGATEGVVEIGDATKALRIHVDRTAAALFPLVTMRRLGSRYFCRVTLSARELDDTSRLEGTGRSPWIDEMAFGIGAYAARTSRPMNQSAKRASPSPSGVRGS